MLNVMYKAAFSSIIFEAFGTAVKGYLLIDIINTFILDVIVMIRTVNAVGFDTFSMH